MSADDFIDNILDDRIIVYGPKMTVFGLGLHRNNSGNVARALPINQAQRWRRFSGMHETTDLFYTDWIERGALTTKPLDATLPLS